MSNIAIGYRISSDKLREVCEDTWIAVAKHHDIEVYSDVGDIGELKSRSCKEWVLWVESNEGVYVHIPHLLQFIESNTEDNNIRWIGKGCSLINGDVTTTLVKPHPHMYNSDYKGCVDFVPQGITVDQSRVLCLCSMSPEAMDVYHIDQRLEPIVPRRKREDNKWTLVTTFFDLTKKNDVTSSSRSLDYYHHHSRGTMSLNQNLVVFCDKTTYPFFKRERERFGLLDKTIFKIVNFEDFPLCKYKSKIVENRKIRPSSDNRNNPSYYLICMARYAMLKEAIAENVFESTHFGWVNMAMEKPGLRNIELLERALRQYRDKFSTVWIDYISKRDIENSYDFIYPGRCSMCSGFFTAKAEIMEKVCTLFEEKFLYYLELGYGHADEQLYSPVYFENPDLFEHYFGDYKQMIANYTEMIENPHTAIHFLISKAKIAGDYPLVYQASKAVYEGFKSRHYALSPQIVHQLEQDILSFESKQL